MNNSHDTDTATDAFDYNDLPVELGPKVFAELQCNILRSVDRPKSTQMFLRFRSRAAFAAWINTVQPSRSDANDSELRNVLFTAEGLKYLGLELQTREMDPAFQRGSRDPATLTKLSDSESPTTWYGHETPWHAVLLVWHDPGYAPPPPTGCEFAIEHGSGINRDGTPIEARHQLSYGHFGVLDGLSKLVYTESDYDALKSERGGAIPRWDPRQQLSTLLVQDLFSESPDAFGSYFVFRKYAQNVVELNRRVGEIAAEIEGRRARSPASYSKQPNRGILPLEQRGFDAFQNVRPGPELNELIKSWVFGRGSEGDSAFGDANKNDFNFDEDVDGKRCPYHAHIRKMNPRGQTGDVAFERTKLLARRGTSYVKSQFRGAAGSDSTRTEKGMLFWSAQASIADQFEFVLERWANGKNVDFQRAPTPDLDSVIGRQDANSDVVEGWKRWKRATDIDFTIWSAVTLVGAEYLYAPSMDGFSQLQSIANMSRATVPRTLLSLLYNTQMSPYREEVHQSHVEATRRFALDDATFAQLGEPSLPNAAAVLNAIDETAKAAFKLRENPGNQSSQVQMDQATHTIFGMLASLLAAEVTSRSFVREPDQPAPNGTVEGLSKLYCLVYSAAYRSDSAREQESGAWSSLLEALRCPDAKPFTDLLPITKAVCKELADSYSTSIWPGVW